MRLVYPNKKYLKSYNEAFQEYKENNVSTYSLEDPNQVDVVKKYYNYRNNINLKPGRVPQTTYWLVDAGKFIGEISIRHYLNDALKTIGGHIGYGIRCSEWGKGFGTKILKLGLKKAKLMGLEKVLITCNDDNYGSAKVIENNGGVLENILEIENEGKTIRKRRYWIELK